MVLVHSVISPDDNGRVELAQGREPATKSIGQTLHAPSQVTLHYCLIAYRIRHEPQGLGP